MSSKFRKLLGFKEKSEKSLETAELELEVNETTPLTTEVTETGLQVNIPIVHREEAEKIYTRQIEKLKKDLISDNDIRELLTFLVEDWNYPKTSFLNEYDLMQKFKEWKSNGDASLILLLLKLLNDESKSIYHHHIYVIIILFLIEKRDRLEYVVHSEKPNVLKTFIIECKKQFNSKLIRKIEDCELNEKCRCDFFDMNDFKKFMNAEALAKYNIIIEIDENKSIYKFFNNKVLNFVKEIEEKLLKSKEICESSMIECQSIILNFHNRKNVGKVLSIIKNENLILMQSFKYSTILTFPSQDELDEFHKEIVTQFKNDNVSMTIEGNQIIVQSEKIEDIKLIKENLIKNRKSFVSVEKVSENEFKFDFYNNDMMELIINELIVINNQDEKQIELEFSSNDCMIKFNKELTHDTVIMIKQEQFESDEKSEIEHLILKLKNEKYKKIINLFYCGFLTKKNDQEVLNDLINKHQGNFEKNLNILIDKEKKRVGKFFKHTLQDHLTIINEVAWKNNSQNFVEILSNFYPHVGEHDTLISNIFKEQKNNIFKINGLLDENMIKKLKNLVNGPKNLVFLRKQFYL